MSKCGGGGCRGQTPRTALALAGDGALQELVNILGLYSPITVALDTVTLIALRTLALTVFQVLVDLPLRLTPAWTGSWDVPAVTLDTGAVFLVVF